VNSVNSVPTPIRIATRGSALALAQANMVLAQCRAAFPDEAFEINIIKTTGDKLQTASLASANLPKGLFTKEIEEALLDSSGDLAVHSLKDLPTELPAGLELGAVSARADVRDVLIRRASPLTPHLSSFTSLPRHATVATSSTRRRAQLLASRPDLKVVDIRGNVGTRLRKLAEQKELDAIILAAAGLERLHFYSEASAELSGEGVPSGLIATPIPVEEMLPCVGQAALGIEIRENDSRIERIARALNDAHAHACVTAERAFLRGMGGGCQLAVAAYGEIIAGKLRLRAISFLGPTPKRGEQMGTIQDAPAIGMKLAQQLR
jgi:hydroxymethylbilane synthase